MNEDWLRYGDCDDTDESGIYLCANRRNAAADLIEQLRQELQPWRELAGAVIMQTHPILPQPEWHQDAAFVAFTIDGLVKKVMES